MLDAKSNALKSANIWFGIFVFFFKDLLTTFQILGVKHDGVPLGAVEGTKPV